MNIDKRTKDPYPSENMAPLSGSPISFGELSHGPIELYKSRGKYYNKHSTGGGKFHISYGGRYVLQISTWDYVGFVYERVGDKYQLIENVSFGDFSVENSEYVLSFGLSYGEGVNMGTYRAPGPDGYLFVECLNNSQPAEMIYSVRDPNNRFAEVRRCKLPRRDYKVVDTGTFNGKPTGRISGTSKGDLHFISNDKIVVTYDEINDSVGTIVFEEYNWNGSEYSLTETYNWTDGVRRGGYFDIGNKLIHVNEDTYIVQESIRIKPNQRYGYKFKHVFSKTGTGYFSGVVGYNIPDMGDSRGNALYQDISKVSGDGKIIIEPAPGKELELIVSEFHRGQLKYLDKITFDIGRYGVETIRDFGENLDIMMSYDGRVICIVKDAYSKKYYGLKPGTHDGKEVGKYIFVFKWNGEKYVETGISHLFPHDELSRYNRDVFWLSGDGTTLIKVDYDTTDYQYEDTIQSVSVDRIRVVNI